MKFNLLKQELIECLYKNHIKISKIIVDEKESFLINISSEYNKSVNSITVHLQNSERFGINAALYASKEYYFDNENNIINKLMMVLLEEIKELKYFNLYGANDKMLAIGIFKIKNITEHVIMELVKNNFIINKNETLEKVIVSNFNGTINYEVNIKNKIMDN